METDVAGAMKNVNARLDAEWTFTLEQTPGRGRHLHPVSAVRGRFQRHAERHADRRAERARLRWPGTAPPARPARSEDRGAVAVVSRSRLRWFMAGTNTLRSPR